MPNFQIATSGSVHQSPLVEGEDVRALGFTADPSGIFRVKFPSESWENASAGSALYSPL